MSFLIISAFLDVMDGRIARYLNVTSEFGANLDSLADFVNFGVVPPLVVYSWVFAESPMKSLGWGVVLIFAICTGMRLARFNIGLKVQVSPARSLFFTGVPSTIGGILCVAPLMASLEFPNIHFVQSPEFNIIYLAVIAFTMPSKLPTFSVKHIHISKENVKLLLAVIGSLIVFLIIKPWITILILCLLYIACIPVSLLVFCRRVRAEQENILKVK